MDLKIRCEVCGGIYDDKEKMIFDCVEKIFVHMSCKTKHNAWRDDNVKKEGQ